jgi:hypothetical protein
MNMSVVFGVQNVNIIQAFFNLNNIYALLL